MQSPSEEIEKVVELVASSGSPDDQKAAVNKYFTSDAGFKNPLMKVDPGPLSRESILGIYQWYRVISPQIKAVVNNVAYDREEDVLFVDVTQSSRNRFLPFRPVPCRFLCRFELRTEHGLHYIKMQEDFFHPADMAGLLLPPLVPVVKSALSVSTFLVNLGAKFAQVLGIWRATPGVERADSEESESESVDESPEDRNRRLKDRIRERHEKAAEEVRRVARSGRDNSESQDVGPYGVYKTGSVAGPVQRD